MTQGMPGFYPQLPSPPPSPVDDTPMAVQHSLPSPDPGVEALSWIVGGGAIAACGLFAWFVVVNNREHEEIRGEVGEVRGRALRLEDQVMDLQQRNAYEHTLLAQEQARVLGHLAQHGEMLTALQYETEQNRGAVLGLVGYAAPVPTVYAEPAFAPASSRLSASLPPPRSAVPALSRRSLTTAPPPVATLQYAEPFFGPSLAQVYSAPPLPSSHSVVRSSAGMPASLSPFVPPSLAPLSYAPAPPTLPLGTLALAPSVAPTFPSPVAPVSVYVQQAPASMAPATLPSAQTALSGAPASSVAATRKLPSHLEDAVTRALSKAPTRTSVAA